ncbi:MAG: phosphoribosylformylglycinamidine synthase subunit PurL, partial [Candidatus Aerophobetes bacterium]|nr:phosphoribosylformylglycinamidine synthase subunit PurL [Candidatus Aerophobetes bacterium]
SLRFGPLNKGRNHYLFSKVVEGAAEYANCLRIPTVGGEVYFDETYEGNPLVNVMGVGVAKKEELIRARATGAGNSILYVGSDTGRDGLGGASFASQELTDEVERGRSAVPIGDPFREKLLLEACLELLKTGVVIGMQDMGAAGLTSSTSETASRGGCGVQIDISLVPKREKGMIPYEVMLSESQERMLLIVKKEKEELAKKVFKKWGLHAVNIGQVTNDGIFRVLDGGKVVVQIPVKALAEDAPVYIRKEKKPKYLSRIRDFKVSQLSEPRDYNGVLKKLLNSPTISSKQWVYQQYDHTVRTDVILLPGADSSLIRIKGTKKAIALTIDGNGRYTYLNPYEGGKIAVAEAARNVACVGAKPLAITNCLNFGSPIRGEVFWQFKRCVEGMAEACRILETPVTGGNVSFYNENPKGAIDPTPVVGMLGLLDDVSHYCTPNFKEKGDPVILLGELGQELGGSEYLKLIHHLKIGEPPKIDLKKEKAVQRTCIQIIEAGLINSAHDCSEGGLAVALAECCISNPDRKLGALINLSPLILHFSRVRVDALLFNEAQSRIIVSCRPGNFARIKDFAERNNVPFFKLGTVGGKRVVIERNEERLIDISVDELELLYYRSFSKGT